MSVSEPLIKLYDPNDSSRYWDISRIATSINIAYGRNQPFAVAEVVVKKAYFTSIQNYWGEVQDVPTDSHGDPELPTTYLIDGQSPIHIEAYGMAYDMCVERHESEQSNDYITLLCYNKAYKLKSATTLNSLSRITLYTDNKLYFAYDTSHSNPLTNALVPSAVYGNPVTATCTLYGTDQVTFSVKVSVNKNGSTYSFAYGEQSVEYIEGTGTNLFRFIAMYGAGYDFEDCICDKGYSYNYGSQIQKTYTTSQIKSIKEDRVHYPLIETPDSGPDQEIIKLRVNSDSNFCWEVLKSIGAMSNRWPFFYDKAYFVDYNTDSQTTMNHIDQYDYMKLDYGLDNQGNSTTYIQQSLQSDDKDYIDLYEIVSNADQGSTYVQTSQKVFGENYSAKVSVSDIADNHTGYELYFPYPEYDPTNPQLVDNTTRNFLTRKIAFNRVVQNYKPSDAVLFHISEMSSQVEALDVGDRIYNDESELPESALTGQYALVISDGVLYTYYRYGGSGWAIDESATQQNDRIQKFSPYTLISEIKDVQNGLVIKNAPLAYTKLMWPSCLTEIVFGNPEFMDAQQQWSALTLEAQVSTEQGTEDSLISDRYASKLVIGNQTMSDLADNREGFTGLIMEKNWDNELYRLSGYNNGVLQAYFNSQGEIMSGDNNVIINQNGIRISGSGSYIDPSLLPESGIPEWDDLKQYHVNDIVSWNGKIYTCLIQNTGVEPGTTNSNKTWETSGNISLWSVLNQYAVGDIVIYNDLVYACIRQTGTTHYAPNSSSGRTYWEQKIDTSNQNVSIIGGSTGSAPQTDTSRASKTVIDSKGLTTYNSSGNAVCRVGTDGNIYGVKVLATDVQAGTLNADVIYGGTIEANKITVNNGKITASQINTTGLTVSYASESGTQESVPQWTSYDTYSIGDVVRYNNRLYTSKRNSNTNHNPSTDTSQTYWESFSESQGKGYARVTPSGFYTYDSNDNLQCSVDDTGEIKQAGGLATMGYNGFTIHPSGSSAPESTDGYGFRILDEDGHLSGGLFSLYSGAQYLRAINNNIMRVSSIQGTNPTAGYATNMSFSATEARQTNNVSGVWIEHSLNGSATPTSSNPYLGIYHVGVQGQTSQISSTTTSSYLVLGNGIVINFGIYSYSSSSAGTHTISFPRAFRTKVLCAGCGTIRTSGVGGSNEDFVGNVTLTGMLLVYDTSDVGCYWYAIGY